VRSGPGEARTILLLHIISVRPSKQPLMVRTFLKVYMELGSYFLFLQEQIKDIIIIIIHPTDNQPQSSQKSWAGKTRRRVG
jgi:GTPase involved in cell partitioning and DNA repair